ncbi:MAG: DegT/DnrJ/EryC1/StrS family aminotransferase [Burkholderiaceae bacterium]
MIRFLDLQRIHAGQRAALLAACERVIDGGQYVLGPEVEAFEAEFAAYCGVRHCIGVANGLDALELALRAWGIGPGDEVIVPSWTFIATWLAVSAVGATPVPVEPADGSFLIDPLRVEAAITPATRAIIAVHLYGAPADMAALAALARRHRLHLLEDAAQAHGARCGGRRAGALGDAAAFSFYPGKNLGALGDGGALTCDDDAFAQRVRRLRNYGSARKYVHEVAGRNSRLDELQAAVLRVKLARLDRENAHRRELAQAYQDGLGVGLAGCALTLPAELPGRESVWHLYVVRTPQRDALQRALAAQGVETGIHYPVACHRQGAYAGRSWTALPRAEQLAAEVLSLPMGPHLSTADVRQVCAVVRSLPMA